MVFIHLIENRILARINNNDLIVHDQLFDTLKFTVDWKLIDTNLWGMGCLKGDFSIYSDKRKRTEFNKMSCVSVPRLQQRTHLIWAEAEPILVRVATVPTFRVEKSKLNSKRSVFKLNGRWQVYKLILGLEQGRVTINWQTFILEHPNWADTKLIILFVLKFDTPDSKICKQGTG